MIDKMKTFLLTICFAFASTLVATAKDIQTLRLTTTPQMHCGGCEARINKALRFAKGVTSIQINRTSQVIIVHYDADKTQPERILKAVDKTGYKPRLLKEKEHVTIHHDEPCPIQTGKVK